MQDDYVWDAFESSFIFRGSIGNQHEPKTKALRSIIVIKFSIKIWIGMSFLQKYKFNFDTIYSVHTELNVFRIFHKYGIFGNPCFDSSSNRVFWPIIRGFEYSILCFVFCKIQFDQYGKYRIRKKTYSEFCQNTKIRIFCLSQALTLNLNIISWLNQIKLVQICDLLHSLTYSHKMKCCSPESGFKLVSLNSFYEIFVSIREKTFLLFYLTIEWEKQQSRVVVSI